jgi:AcrR family transcriptional regulator
LRERARDVYRSGILEAADVVFARKGFGGAHISDIARAAGFATGTVYNYFDSKDEVFRSLFELRGEQFLESAKNVLNEHADAMERLAALVRASLAFLGTHQATYAVFVELGGTSETSIRRIGGDTCQKLYHRYLALYERVIGEAVQARRLRSDWPLEELVALLTGAMNGIAARWLWSRSTGSPVDKAEMILDFFQQGARARR